MMSATPTMIPGRNSTAATAAAKKASLLKQALIQHNNESVPWHFAIAMAGVITLFTLFHWSRYLYSRYASKELRRSVFMRSQVAIAR